MEGQTHLKPCPILPNVSAGKIGDTMSPYKIYIFELCHDAKKTIRFSPGII